MLDPRTSVNDLLLAMPDALPALNALGIDTCCEGDLSLAEAAERCGKPISRVMAEIADAVATAAVEGTR